jgi:hypothetical protein
MTLFSTFQDIYSGCCTVAAQTRGHEPFQVTEWLAERRLGYREALRSLFERFLRLDGCDKSEIYTICNVRSGFL